MTIGPMQLVVVGFAGGEPRGEILAELQRLAERDVVRLVDALVVRKHEDGQIQLLEIGQVAPDDAELGALVGQLTGLTAEANGTPAAAERAAAVEEDVWYVADAIPPGAAAAVALLEHRWAIPLREAMQGLGGELLAESWVHPLDLEAIGLTGTAADG
jgi:uncharacterized membrane protein